MNDIEYAAFRRLDMNLLVAFDALVSEKNVTRAAARLCVGQPAMSHSLARLRELFADELLYREGGAMELTQKAETLAPCVRQLLRDTQKLAFTDQNFDPGVVTGEFKLALNDPLEALLLPSLVAKLRVQAPNLILSVQPIPAWQQLECLDKGVIQLAVGYFPKVGSVHEQRELYTAPFACVLNPDLVDLDSPFDLIDLAGKSHIHTSYTGTGPGLVDSAFLRRNLKRNIVANTASPLSIPFIIKQSPLVAILPTLVTRLFEAHVDLRIEPLALEDLRLPISMVIHRRDLSDPLVLFFIKELLSASMVVFPSNTGS